MCCPDQIFKESEDASKQHSDKLDSQYAYQVGYLKVKIIELCAIINTTRSELNRVSLELNQIGEH